MLYNALCIATKAHENQFRKWGDDLYIVHPISVVEKLKTLEYTNEVDYAAGYLHDVIEDVAIPNNNIKYYEDLITKECSKEVLDLVWELTNPTSYPKWDNKPREEKRKKDWEHIRTISDRAKIIKMVDRMDNLSSYELIPHKLLYKYMNESKVLLQICENSDIELGKELKNLIEIIEDYYDTSYGDSVRPN